MLLCHFHFHIDNKWRGNCFSLFDFVSFIGFIYDPSSVCAPSNPLDPTPPITFQTSVRPPPPSDSTPTNFLNASSLSSPFSPLIVRRPTQPHRTYSRPPPDPGRFPHRHPTRYLPPPHSLNVSRADFSVDGCFNAKGRGRG